MRKFRTQAFSAAVNLLGLAAKHRPQLILGVQQGGLVAALAGFPLLMETACRLRAVPQSELAEFRRGWAGVQALLIANPAVSPSTVLTTIRFVGDALPEMWRVQPRGLPRSARRAPDLNNCMYIKFHSVI